MFAASLGQNLKKLVRSRVFLWSCIAAAVYLCWHLYAFLSHLYTNNLISFGHSVFQFNSYISLQTIDALKILLPFFAIGLSMATVYYDLRDNFFWSEVSYQFKAPGQFAAKIFTLLVLSLSSVCIITVLSFGISFLHGFHFVNETWLNLIFNVIFSLLLCMVFIALPCLLFYIGLTLLIGYITKSPTIAAMVSLSHIATSYIIMYYYHPPASMGGEVVTPFTIYNQYANPLFAYNSKLSLYITYSISILNPNKPKSAIFLSTYSNISMAAVNFGIITIFAFIFVCIAYYFLKKRVNNH